MNVVEEIVDIRERVARMETDMRHIKETVEKSQQQIRQIPKEGGSNVVIPVTVAVGLIQVVQAVLEKMF